MTAGIALATCRCFLEQGTLLTLTQSNWLYFGIGIWQPLASQLHGGAICSMKNFLQIWPSTHACKADSDQNQQLLQNIEACITQPHVHILQQLASQYIQSQFNIASSIQWLCVATSHSIAIIQSLQQICSYSQLYSTISTVKQLIIIGWDLHITRHAWNVKGDMQYNI